MSKILGIIKLITIVLMFIGLGITIGYSRGENETFTAFRLGECRLDNIGDVVCIKQVN